MILQTNYNMEKEWVCIAKFNDAQTSSIAKAILTENEIEAVEINKKDSATTLFGYIELMVAEPNQEKATELISSLINIT